MSFDALPTELLADIVSRLSFADYIATSFASHRLYNLTAAKPAHLDKPAHILVPRARHRRLCALKQLFQLEQWYPSRLRDPDGAQEMFACEGCLRLRPRHKFTSAMTTKKKRGEFLKKLEKGPSVMDQLIDEVVRSDVEEEAKLIRQIESHLATRFCIDCGVTHGKYRKGTLLTFTARDGAGKSVQSSGIVCKRCGKFHEVPQESRQGIRRTCARCLEYRPPGSR